MYDLKNYVLFLQEDNKKIVEKIKTLKESSNINVKAIVSLYQQLKNNNDELLKIAFANKKHFGEKVFCKKGVVR